MNIDYITEKAKKISKEIFDKWSDEIIEIIVSNANPGIIIIKVFQLPGVEDYLNQENKGEYEKEVEITVKCSLAVSFHRSQVRLGIV